MADALKIALILTAFDRASGVIDSMTNRANANFDKMRKASREMAEGFGLMAAGQQGFNLLKGPIKDFAEVEKSAARLKANLLDSGGGLNGDEWARVTGLARDLGNELPGTTSDFYKMFTVMKQLGTETETILGGTGRAAAALAVVTGESYETVAAVAGKLQNATGVQAKDMTTFFDVIARARNIGVPLEDMVSAFARSSGQLKFLGLQGLDTSKQLTTFFATFIRQGLSGQTVGTNFSRILGEVLNPKKYQAMQQAAHQYGITLDLLDKKGNFGGLDNFITQFDKLSGLSNDKISAILSPLTGAEGLDDQMLKALSRGRSENDKTGKLFGAQADIMKKQSVQLATLDAQFEALEGTWTNVKASFASSLKPTLDSLLQFLNFAVAGLQRFVEANPKLSQIIGTFIAVASSAMMVAGAIRIISAAMAILKITTLAGLGPVIILVTGLALLAQAIIADWKPISAFFINLWTNVKTSFLDFVNWVYNIPGRLYQAGMNIVSSIWEGIKSKWGEFMAWWAEKIQVVRDYLPFSPAKRGALRDIHRIRLVETIAQGIKAKPMLDAMDNTMGAVANYRGGRRAGMGAGNSHITYAPVYNVTGAGSLEDIRQVQQEGLVAFDRKMKEWERQKERKSF